MRLYSGLHDLITMDLSGFDRDGDAYVTIRQRSIHKLEEIEDQVCFVFKNIEQMEKMQKWLNTRIDEAGKPSVSEDN